MGAVITAGGTATDELDLVRETAAQLAVRSIGEQASACWRRVQQTGLTDLRRADGDGAAGSVAMAAAVVEQLARAVGSAPVLGHLVATELARVAGLDVADEPLTVVVDPRWETLAADGVAIDAALADRALAVTDDGAVRRVELGAPIAGADSTRPVREVGERSLEPTGELPAGGLDAVVAFARILVTADLVGAAGGVFDEAVRYAGDRVQFGVAIGSFQAVQHLLAEAFVDLEAMHSSLLFAIRALDEDDVPLARQRALVAKAYASDAALEVVQRCVQVFGGIAITTEHRAHRHLRRVLVDRELFGRPAVLNDRLLDLVPAG